MSAVIEQDLASFLRMYNTAVKLTNERSEKWFIKAVAINQILALIISCELTKEEIVAQVFDKNTYGIKNDQPAYGFILHHPKENILDEKTLSSTEPYSDAVEVIAKVLEQLTP